MTALDDYLDLYGFHFNKKLYEWAVSKMTDKSGNKVTPKTKEEVDTFLKAQGVTLKNNKGWDAAYVHAMLMADCWGSSYTTEKQLALGVSDFLDDKDGSKTKAFDHFVVDYKAQEEPIFWEDFL